MMQINLDKTKHTDLENKLWLPGGGMGEES